ncbi:YaaC family protein [Actinoplanes sp. HUAS TT8]|uniref:YaaC family protein n=1 Tax=Actinoplanes sp. HUAS TT8 TaxID=3447453 RepID=UPI003F51BB4D
MIAEAWRDIRALRAQPTGLAAADLDRAALFKAALRQAEDLAVAASASDYATSPLTLFYAVEQAGQAIIQARKPSISETVSSHGLTLRPSDDGLLTSRMCPPRQQSTRPGGFQDVCATIGSPSLTSCTELGALWAANPDLAGVPIPAMLGSWARPLESRLGSRWLLPRYDGPVIDLATQLTATSGEATVQIDIPGKTAAEVLEVMAGYPSLASARPLKMGPWGDRFADGSDTVIRNADASPWSPLAYIAVPAPHQMLLQDYWRLLDSLFSVTEEQNGEVHGIALPAVGGRPAPIPLMLWWALLLGLSSLVRYHPTAWTRAIDLVPRHAALNG